MKETHWKRENEDEAATGDGDVQIETDETIVDPGTLVLLDEGWLQYTEDDSPAAAPSVAAARDAMTGEDGGRDV